MRITKKNTFVGDFETTVYEGQKRTDVWASALTQCFDKKDEVKVFASLPETYNYISRRFNEDIIIFYHNLKFDGSFWLSYLHERGDFKEAYNEKDGLLIYEGTRFERKLPQGEFLPDDKMPKGSFKYLVSDMGAWYTITIKRHDGKIIELRDSLKLIPCSVAKMGQDFKTKHQKTDIEYTGFRKPGGVITDVEKEYIANDVLVVKEVLETMFTQGHKRLTIGSCCMREYKDMIGDFPKYDSRYDQLFPKLEYMNIDANIYGDDTVDAYIRRSYHGGWCYVKDTIAGEPIKGGVTADVNSLYPSVMSGESGNRYPIGQPTFFQGEEEFRKIEQKPELYYYIRVRTRFYLKDGYLPFIQIKRNKLYKSTEMLKTSDVYDKRTGKYHKYLRDYKTGEVKTTTVEVTFSKTDWELVQEHYNLEETVILDGCWFHTSIGIFDPYINKYKKIKETSSGAIRSIAKLFLFLNNLYGKLAAGTNSSFKHLVFDKLGVPHEEIIFENGKEAGYIADGAAITSYARAFTIRAAQKNYKVFCYADTDSLHLNCKPEEVVGIEVHPTKFLCWKLESFWDEGRFIRQKTYAEHVTHEDEKKLENPYWNVKCAGLPDKCKKLLIWSIEGVDKIPEKEYNKLSQKEKDFVAVKRTIEDFKSGLVIPGKLLPVHIPGGVVLADVDYTLRE